MALFVKCWYCNKRINLGEKVFVRYDGDEACILCSQNCFLKEYALEYELDIDTIDVSNNQFYDTETIRAQIRSLEASIEHSHQELKRLKKEIEQG